MLPIYQSPKCVSWFSQWDIHRGIFIESFLLEPLQHLQVFSAATSDNLFIPSNICTRDEQVLEWGCHGGGIPSANRIKSLMTLGFWNGSMDSFHGNRWQETMDSTTKHGAFLWGFPSTNARMIWCWPISGCITWWNYRLMGWSCMW